MSSWPLKVHSRAVLFRMFVKMYIKLVTGDIFSKIMKDMEVTLLKPLMYGDYKAKRPRHSV